MKRSEATLTLTLRDGAKHSWKADELPKSVGARTWKSWVMRQMPYGTDFFACKWGVEKGA